MADVNVDDRVTLDRDVARAAAAVARWRRDVAADPDGAHVGPLEGLRHVAGKSTWDALGAIDVGAADQPIRTGLRRWTAALLQARLSADDDVALAREESSARAVFEGDPARAVSWREAWRGIPRARTPAALQRWLNAAAEGAVPVADARRTRLERRAEVARRLGFAHPWDALVPPAASSSLQASARGFLDATEDLWRQVRRESLRATQHPGAADVLHAVVAREAGEGWPARLTARWFSDAFGAGASRLPIELPPPPEALGAASFARALRAFGYAWRVAAAPRAAPFSVRSDPAFVGAHRYGALFGSLAADPAFHARALGLGQARAAAQCRVLARTALLDARLDATRIVLGAAGAQPPADVFDEMGERLFGAPLDARLRGAWPVGRDDEPARWVALLKLPALRRSTRDSFDTDWFKNPKAWAHLVARSAVPAYEPLEEGCLDAGPMSLGKVFEEALG
jgi:hypothetical protein